MKSDKTLKELLCLLADSGIPFVVVGGYAAMMHGSSLLTQDIDICAVLSPENEKFKSSEFILGLGKVIVDCS